MLWGIVIIPVVMQPDWFKNFVKVADIYFFIPAGSIPECPANMHEALTIGLYFTFIIHQPWDWYQVQFRGRLGSMLSALCRTELAGGRDFLRRFWCAHNWIATIPSGLAHTLLLAETWHKLLGA